MKNKNFTSSENYKRPTLKLKNIHILSCVLLMMTCFISDNLLAQINITISTITSNGSWSGNTFVPNADDATVASSEIESRLNAGGTVTISTTVTGSQHGKITVANSITKTAGADATLILNADYWINVNAAISSTNNKLHFQAESGKKVICTISNRIGQFRVQTTGSITTNGGNITVIGANNSCGSVNCGGLNYSCSGNTCRGIQIEGPLNAGGGNISLSGVRINGGLTQGVNINSSVTTTGSGTITIDGESDGTSIGTAFGSSAVIRAQNGTLAIIGEAKTTGDGISLSSAIIETTGTGNLILTSDKGQISGASCAIKSGGTTAVDASGYNITLSNELNRLSGTVSLFAGNNIILANNGALRIGNVSALGTINIYTTTGDLSLIAEISTLNTSANAIILNSGKSTNLPTATGGNIIYTSGQINPGSGGTAILYTGTVSGSTGLAFLSNYNPSNVYFGSDETTSLNPAVGSGLYIAYRENPSFIWNGSLNSDWDNTVNWSPNFIPKISNDVTIPLVSNLPVIGLGINAFSKNATINSDASVTINQGGELSIAENLTNNGVLNIKSNTTGDGSLLLTGTISGTGTCNVERYLAANKWHLVSSPITNGLSGVFLDIWLRPYDESTNTFGSYITPVGIPMTTGQGFSVWTNSANEVRTFSGTINNGTIGPIALAKNNLGWNLIGNPYPSAIDWNAASGWTKNSVANSVYVWNGTSGNYATWNGSAGTNGGSRYIPMEQGFFVQATSVGANISMNNSVRVHNSVGYMKTGTEDPENSIRVKVNCQTNSDETVILISDNGSDVFNTETDAYKLPGSSTSPQMHTTKADNSNLAISTLLSTSDIVGKYIYLDYAETGAHQLIFTHTLTGNNIPRLFDHKAQTFVEPYTPYNFNASVGDTNTRFQFIEPLPASINDSQNSSTLTVWESNNTLYINHNATETLKQVSIYSTDGKLVYNGVQTVTNLNHLSSGVYLVKVTTDKSTQVKKISLK